MKESDNSPEPTPGQDGDKDIARLLEAAGPRAELPEDMKQRWESHFRAELAPVIAAQNTQPRRRFGLPLAALAASIIALVLALDLFTVDNSGQIPIQIAAVQGDARLITGKNLTLAAVAGQNLQAGVALSTGANGLIAVDWAGYDLRLNANSRAQLYADHIELQAGEIFVNDLGRRLSVRQITVVTPFATIRDIGTQFKVRLTQDAVISSVRQGSIEVLTGDEEHRANASPGQARQLSVLAADNSVHSGEDNSDWEWIYPVARQFRIDGRTVYEFLRWSVRESGRELVFASEETELAARTTRFPGPADISTLDPESAVPRALQTTLFRAVPQADNSLRVERIERR